MSHKGRMRSQTAGDGVEIAHYHVTPEDVGGPARRGGLVLIQEIFGVTDHIKELADGFAADGYEVIAPALFDRMEPGFAVGYEPDDIARARDLAGKVNWDHVVLDVQTAADQLADKGPVVLTGYCFGGTVAWVAACRVHGLAATVGYYGRLIIDFVDESPRAPVMLHFGEQDHTIPMENVRTIMARHPGVPVHVYPAGHGFNSDRRTDYSAECTKLARERTLAFFDAHTS